MKKIGVGLGVLAWAFISSSHKQEIKPGCHFVVKYYNGKKMVYTVIVSGHSVKFGEVGSFQFRGKKFDADSLLITTLQEK